MPRAEPHVASGRTAAPPASGSGSQADLGPARSAAGTGSQEDLPPGSSAPRGSDAPPGHTMVTRLRDNTRKAMQRTNGTVMYDPSRRVFLASREPTDHREALHSLAWRAAMQLELAALHHNGT